MLCIAPTNPISDTGRRNIDLNGVIIKLMPQYDPASLKPASNVRTDTVNAAAEPVNAVNIPVMELNL